MRDILFGNNNKKILKKMALAELKADRLKTGLSGAVIFISTCLMAMVFAILLNDALSRANSTPYHVTYQAVEKQAAESLKNDGDFEAVGVYKYFGAATDEYGRTNLAYMDETVMELWNYDLTAGVYPEEDGEVLVSASYLEQNKLGIGDTFEFSYTETLTNRDKVQKFSICGIIRNKKQEAGKQFYILVPELFLSRTAREELHTVTSSYSTQTMASVDVIARLGPGKRSLEPDAQRAYLLDKGKELGIEEYNVYLNNGYIEGYRVDGAVAVGILGFVVFLMLAGSFVIYSIFHISVVNRVKMYAQLMLIGATGRQLRRFVAIQGNILALCFIPPGVLVSLGAAYLLSSGEWLAYDILCVTAAGILIYAVIKTALYRPAGILARLMPVPAMHYSGTGADGRHRPLGQITPKTLAVNNLYTNRGRNRMCLISLSVSGILMIAFVILLESIDVHGMLMQSYPLGEEFQIGIRMDNLYERLGQIEKDNPLSDELTEQIYAVPGVENVMKEEGIIGRIISPEIHYGEEGDNRELINSLSPKLLEGINGIVEGKAGYDDIGTDGIMINQYRVAASDYNYGDIRAGDEVVFQFDVDGNIVERAFRVTGIVFFPSTGLFYTTSDIINDISPYNHTLHLSVICDREREEETRRGLEGLLSRNPDLNLLVYSEDLRITENAMRVYLSGVYGIFIIIILFGILNMVNMLINSALLRKREFALLEAVGMTGKQLRRMLYREGMDISIKASVIAAVGGTLSGGLLCYLVNELLSLKFVRFHISVWPVLLFAAMLVGVQTAVSAGICKMAEGSCLAERVRDAVGS